MTNDHKKAYNGHFFPPDPTGMLTVHTLPADCFSNSVNEPYKTDETGQNKSVLAAQFAQMSRNMALKCAKFLCSSAVSMSVYPITECSDSLL